MKRSRGRSKNVNSSLDGAIRRFQTCVEGLRLERAETILKESR